MVTIVIPPKNPQGASEFLSPIIQFHSTIYMSAHIHSPKNKKCEFDSHKKLVVDIRSAVAEHKKTQHTVDAFMIGVFLVFVTYAMLR